MNNRQQPPAMDSRSGEPPEPADQEGYLAPDLAAGEPLRRKWDERRGKWVADPTPAQRAAMLEGARRPQAEIEAERAAMGVIRAKLEAEFRRRRRRQLLRDGLIVAGVLAAYWLAARWLWL